MRAPAYTRIQWLHEKLLQGSLPNAARVAEYFHISRRQAQRDIEFMRKRLGAPLAYDRSLQGYRYTAPFVLPFSLATENDGEPDLFGTLSDGADSLIIQKQIPYTATLRIEDKLTVLEMRAYILSREGRGRYLCEFHHIDRFLCAILTARSGIVIEEPAWLRDRLIHLATKALEANRAADDAPPKGQS